MSELQVFDLLSESRCNGCRNVLVAHFNWRLHIILGAIGFPSLAFSVDTKKSVGICPCCSFHTTRPWRAHWSRTSNAEAPRLYMQLLLRKNTLRNEVYVHIHAASTVALFSTPIMKLPRFVVSRIKRKVTPFLCLRNPPPIPLPGFDGRNASQRYKLFMSFAILCF